MDYAEAYDGYVAQGILRIDAEIVKKAISGWKPTVKPTGPRNESRTDSWTDRTSEPGGREGPVSSQNGSIL